MIRNLKTMGLALVAVFAMSAIAASAASAEPFWFKSDAGASAVTFLEGSQKAGQNDVFKTDAGEVTCETATYNGEGEGVGPTLTTIKVTPVYTNCKLGTIPAVVDPMGCTYVFHTHTKTSATQFDVTTTIACTAGNEVTVTVTVGGVQKCRIDIPAQTIATGITATTTEIEFEKEKFRKDITADVSINPTFAVTGGITYTQTEGSGLGKCAAASDTTNGTYVGVETLEGKNSEGAKTAIWVE